MNLYNPYLNTQTNEYPLYIGDLQIQGIDPENPPKHIVQVQVEVPEFDRNNELLYEENPVQDENGIWHATFATRPLTKEEKLANARLEVKRKVLREEPLTKEEALLLAE